MADKKLTRQQMEAEGYAVYWVDNGDGTYSERVVASGGGGAASTVAISQTGDENKVDIGTMPALPAGTNNIGDVDVLTLPATPAGTNLIGQIAAGAQTGAVYEGATALTPKYAFANVAQNQTDAALVAAVASKKIRVLALVMVTGATATNVTFNSKPAGAGAAKSALFANAANGGVVLPFNPVGWFETVVDEGLSVTTAAGSTTGIQVVYVEAA